MSPALYYLSEPTLAESTRRFQRTSGGGAEQIEDQGFYAVVIRHRNRPGWIFRFRSLDKYARTTLNLLNAGAVE